MRSLAQVAEKGEDNWILYEILLNHKNLIHSQIDSLIREKENTQTKVISSTSPCIPVDPKL